MKLEDLSYPFWIASARAGATTGDIERAEAFLGKRLPAEFSKALTIQDGGVSNYSTYRRDDYSVPLPAFFTVEALLDAARNRAIWGTPEGIVAIASGAHDWLGLDYRYGDEPRIVYQESEGGDLELVADSFDSLLDGLTED